MGIRKYNPTSPGRRGMTTLTYEEITSTTPHRALLSPRPSKAGRNHSGSITVRHRGAGHKRLLRKVDFFFTDKKDIPAKVETIEYDPGRSAFIALVCYRDGERRYVIAHSTMKVGDMIITSENTKPIAGNRLIIANIPSGLTIYNVELIVGQGACSVRSAGTSALIVSQEGEYTNVRMPSGEIRRIHKSCWATVGAVGNADHGQIKIGKAGRNRWKGWRPTVLGKSMNAVDHPHGGGEGHSPIGMKAPKTPWGKPALGVKTRHRKDTDRWVVRTRKGQLKNG